MRVLVASAGLLSAPSVAVMSESFWWAVVCGVVAASCALATPVALRLWRSGVTGLRGSEPDRDRTSFGRETAPAVAGRHEERAQRELLEAIDRHGGITPARTALETSLTVAEADRMPSDLAKGGHLEGRAEGGKLPYGL